MSSSLEREVSRQMKKRRGLGKRRTSRLSADSDRSLTTLFTPGAQFAPGDDAGPNGRRQRSASGGATYGGRLAPGDSPPRRSSPAVVTVIDSRPTGTFASAGF
jgi:hypothetical protein